MKMERRGAYLVNSDKDEFTKYKALKSINEARENELKSTRDEISTVKAELQELKELLKGLVKDGGLHNI